MSSLDKGRNTHAALAVVTLVAVFSLASCSDPPASSLETVERTQGHTMPASKSADTGQQDSDQFSPTSSEGEGRLGILEGPTYAEVAQLKQASDAVVVATIERVVARELDNPNKGIEGAPPGIPVVILEAAVNQSLKGALSPGAKFNLYYYDISRKDVMNDITPLSPDERLLLFLRSAPNGAPGIQSVKSYYNAIGRDQGIFDFANGNGIARSESVRSVHGEATPAYVSNRLKVSVADIENAPAVTLPNYLRLPPPPPAS